MKIQRQYTKIKTIPQTVKMQSLYLDTQRQVNQFKGTGFNLGGTIVTQSNPAMLSQGDYSISRTRPSRINETNGILISYQRGCSGMLIPIGAKIAISSCHVYFRMKYMFRKSEAFPIQVWSKGNSDECERQTSQNKREDDRYWADVEAGWDEDGLFDDL